MKKIIIIIIFILLLFAENTNAQTGKLNYELEFTSKVASLAIPVDFLGKEFIRPSILIDAGVNLRYSINEKNRVGSGVIYSVKGNSFIFDESYNFPDNFSQNNTYNYIEIPLFFEHSFNKIVLKTGLIYQRLFFTNIKFRNVPDSIFGQTKEEFLRYDEREFSSYLKKRGYNMNNAGFMLSLGKHYDLNYKMYWGWGLQFKTNLFPLFKPKENEINAYLYSFGINLKIGLK